VGRGCVCSGARWHDGGQWSTGSRTGGASEGQSASAGHAETRHGDARRSQVGAGSTIASRRRAGRGTRWRPHESRHICGTSEVPRRLQGSASLAPHRRARRRHLRRAGTRVGQQVGRCGDAYLACGRLRENAAAHESLRDGQGRHGHPDPRHGALRGQLRRPEGRSPEENDGIGFRTVVVGSSGSSGSLGAAEPAAPNEPTMRDGARRAR
jgi:hypothetical protein